MSRRPPLIPLVVVALIALGLAVAGCGGQSGGASGPGDTKLSLVAYSTPKEAYEEIIPAFTESAAGRGIGFNQSYGASGEQGRAVAQGLSADVVALSLEPDITKLVEKGYVSENWNKDPFKGFVTNSVVTLVVRKGNPKKIKGWDDLVKPGIEVITPNPFTSGGARWNVMAAYGAQIEKGKSPQEAEAYLERLFKNVPVQDKSARESLQTFAGGKGDVLIAYENEALTAQDKGEEIEYITPPETILIQNPIAVVSKSKNQQQATKFVEYLREDAAQKVFADKGYRSITPSQVDEDKYPKPKKLFTIDDVGGWTEVSKKFFDPESSVMSRIEEGLNVPTE